MSGPVGDLKDDFEWQDKSELNAYGLERKDSEWRCRATWAEYFVCENKNLICTEFFHLYWANEEIWVWDTRNEYGRLEIYGETLEF